MDFGNKLEELQLTTDEINRFSKALKDDKFRAMLHEYAEEISNPENRKKYEEEITQLEQEKGNNVKFIHPKPHHVLKTSIGGKEKCFINVCSNELMNKPLCKAGRSEDGRVGQQWSLPYSLSPGRPDRDAKGNRCMIYDVVFHPDTLYIAEKNKRFMELVNSTATQGIEDAFKVKLDKMNVKVLKTQYKGVPHPAVIRKPISGDPGKEEAAPNEPLSSLYPVKSDIISNQNCIPLPTTPTQGGPSPVKHTLSLLKQPTKPNYTIKYRSVVDLQDYRCSRDSAPSPRPKELVISIDLPLLKSAGDADLNISERNLVLESQKPAYRLELQLSYPVDGNKGDAKFNKAKKQLIITLPVLPAMDLVVHNDANQLVWDDENDKGECEDKGEGVVNDAGKSGLVRDEESKTKLPVCNCDTRCLKNRAGQNEKTGCQFYPDSEMNFLELNSVPSPSVNTADTPPIFKENDETLRLKQNATNEQDDFCTTKMHHSKEKKSNSNPTEEKDHSDIESTELLDLALASVFQNATHTKDCFVIDGKIAENSQPTLTVAQTQISQPVPQLEKELHVISNGPNSSQQLKRRSVVEVSVVSEGSSKISSIVDEDSKSQVDISIKNPPVLRETNPEDGSEVIISDHATSSALSFQNSLRFELD